MSTPVAGSAILLETIERLNLLPEETMAELRAVPELREEEMLTALVETGQITRFQSQALARGMGPQLQVNGYLLLEPIGNGATGTVYKALTKATRALVALKLVPRRNVVNLKTLSAKVEAMKEVRHPRVSAMIDVGTIREWAYTVYPFLEGGEKLDSLVRRFGRLPAKQSVQIGIQVASGLQSYHQHGLFHGLLKPNEVVIGSDRRVRLLDFGVGFLLACERGKSLLSTTTNGKAMARGLDCASPESIIDPLDRTPLGDQYSLGCILYFCLTGQFPFPEENPVKKMMAHQFEQPVAIRQLVPELPERLEQIVERMLAKSPADRYSGMGEVIEELQALCSDPRALPASMPRPRPAPPIRPSERLEQAPSPASQEPLASTASQELSPPTRGLPAWVPIVLAITAGMASALGFAMVWRG
jgi:serine/threonine-protein kinase